MPRSRAKDPLVKRLLRWIYPDQRLANRHSTPPLIAYPGVVRSSNEYSVGDISLTGFFLITDERWIIGTGFPITLERTDEAGAGLTLTLHSTAVRSGEDGVAFTFAQPATEQSSDNKRGAATRSDLTKLAQFLKGIRLDAPSAETIERNP
jgi:hypothetical protein